MLDPDEKRTRASTMHVQLRAEILEGRLLPGAKLNIRSLCDRFSTGLSPVREALNRLSAEGLVSQSDNRGFAVRDVSVPELLDLTQARCWLNEIGLRESIRHGGAEWEEAVLVTCHRLGRTPRMSAGDSTRPNPAWNREHKAFHQTLISACGSAWLVETCSDLFDSAERYRSLARLAGVSRSDPRDEHQEIMQAAIDRQADLAVELMIAHLQRTATLVRNVVIGETSEGATG